MEDSIIQSTCDNFLIKIKEEINTFNLPKNFIEIVKSLEQTKGKIIVTGIGKSGHIGKKIAATMSSLGASSFFVHLSEILHGDFGMITKQDSLIIISTSGEASEFQYLVPYCRENKINTIAITRNKNSFLAKNVNLVAEIQYTKDLLENQNIPAPIISSILTVITGDLIALGIAIIRQFSVFDYKKLHPAGKIGFLTKQAFEVMIKTEDILKCNYSDTFQDICMQYLSAKNKDFIYSEENGNFYILEVNKINEPFKEKNFPIMQLASTNCITADYLDLLMNISQKIKDINFIIVKKNASIIGIIKTDIFK